MPNVSLGLSGPSGVVLFWHLDGMQHSDGEIEKLIRGRLVDMKTGCAYATNSGNLQLELSDLVEEPLPSA